MSTTQEPEPTPLPTRVRTYTQDEVDDLDLYALSTDILDTLPFDWQVDTSENILLGNDVILDVGTGNGKSLTFTLSLLPNETDMNLVVCPLTALMIDQTTNAKISTVAVCSETLEAVGRDAMFADIVAGKYRLILVSPEIAISKVFSQKVLSQANFTRHLRSVCIDEAHCISLWGGSFRPDYAGLGILRGRLPSHIPFLVASATLPSHILDDVCSKLQLSKDAHRVSLTNDRRNVSLSVHQMKHSEESKADLRYLIPDGAVYPSEVPQTIIYCNQRLTCEDAADRAREWAEDVGMIGVPKEWIVFYHAKLGAARKREIEEMIRDGRARLVFCTDALGMGCDFRSVLRVVLWGLPPSFCALAQRAGRAVRDMDMDGEATLFVSQNVYSKGVKEIEIGLSLAEVVADAEAENRGGDIEAVLESQGVDLAEEQEVVSVEEVGVRVSGNADEEEEQADVLPAATTARGRKLRMKEGYNRREALYLSRFVAGKECRRKVWNDFFGNGRKIQLKYLETTLFKERDKFV
ncbi:P-loop containing nucleoside triphosphate hydrolase protein, partial [Coprinellus micaceus]